MEAMGDVTTPCSAPCTPACTAPVWECHDRHVDPSVRGIHDPAACERERAALDEHSRLSWELEQAEGRLSERLGPGADDCDGADRPG